MARIIHVCQRCGHQADDHTRDSCSLNWCDCSSVDWELGPSQLVKTYRFKDRTEVTGVHPPGQRLTAFGAPPIETCGCADCKALYADVTGVSA